MNQCSPVADHSLREARACHVSVASSLLSVLGSQFSVLSSQFSRSVSLRTDNFDGRGRKGGKKISAPGNLLRHLPGSPPRLIGGKFSAPGDLLRHLRGSPPRLIGGNSVHRATYCAHNYPLPLLPSGPGGVGGITSRRTRHRNHFTTQPSPSFALATCIRAKVAHAILDN
jgi:hypothetical protein